MMGMCTSSGTREKSSRRETGVVDHVDGLAKVEAAVPDAEVQFAQRHVRTRDREEPYRDGVDHSLHGIGGRARGDDAAHLLPRFARTADEATA